MTPATITQWLQEPDRNLNPEDLQSLQERYPYFIPLHYMQAALHHQDEQAAPDRDGRLFMGNWLLYHELLERSGRKAQVVSAVVVESPLANFGQQLQSEAPLVGNQQEDTQEAAPTMKEDVPLIRPVYAEDYFRHQGVSAPGEVSAGATEDTVADDPKSLMVVMSFTEWLMHFKTTTEKEKEDEAGRKAVRHMWQKEKLAAALEEEDDDIPENVFEMAVNSISKEDGLVSESLAEILSRQGKYEKAIEMYRKLSLRNPQKSAYFAQQIASIQKNAE